jgi:hypothetical protein
MKTPEGLDLIGIGINADEMIQLLRSLYGLKQAPRQWKKKIDEMMFNLGFKKSMTDEAVYYKSGCIVAVYVDDWSDC